MAAIAWTREALKKLDFIRARKHAYQLVFSSPAGQIVLRDLVRFCRARETCFHQDPRLHAVAEGRREVFLRVDNNLRLTSEQLFALAEGLPLPQEDEEESNG